MTAPAIDRSLAARYCAGVTADGEGCRQVVGLSGSGLCLWHDPARTNEATAARRRGATSADSRPPLPTDVPAPPAPDDLEGVIAWHRWITVALASGQITQDVAKGLAYNLQGLRTALPLRDLETKYRELKAKVAAMEKAADR